jgi:hypothetical protein
MAVLTAALIAVLMAAPTAISMYGCSVQIQGIASKASQSQEIAIKKAISADLSK